MDEYQKQANDFAKKYNVKLKVLGVDYKKHFDSDKQMRYVFKLRLSRNRKSHTFEFGQSYHDCAKEPTFYDVFACLQKYDVGTFENFCSEFGYDTDSRRAERVYKAVCKEYAAVERLFGDCLDELSEIC
jgi:hypothetical protein